MNKGKTPPGFTIPGTDNLKIHVNHRKENLQKGMVFPGKITADNKLMVINDQRPYNYKSYRNRPVVENHAPDKTYIVQRTMSEIDRLPPIGADVPPEDFLDSNGNNDLPPEDEEQVERGGFIEQIQDEAGSAKRINPRATFQPKQKPVQSPRLPERKIEVKSGQTKVTGERGVTLQEIKTVPTRTFEMSRPGQRPGNESLGIQASKITSGAGGYTVEELRIFLRKLGLSTTGNKPELAKRLRDTLGQN